MRKSNYAGVWAGLVLCGMVGALSQPSAAADKRASQTAASEAPANCEWRRTKASSKYALLYCLNGSRPEIVTPPSGFDERTLELARGGDLRAMTLAGVFYASDRSKGGRDVSAAFGWFQRAAETGQATAMFNLGLAYQQGVGVAKDESLARQWFERAAAAGSTSAGLNLARAMFTGSATPNADEVMLKFVRAAADAGTTDGLVDMGILHAAGRGVARDDAEAVRWWKSAAEKKDIDAAYRLGVAYADGIGVQKDDQQSIAWFHTSTKGTMAMVDAIVGITLATVSPQRMTPDNLEAMYRADAERGVPAALLTLAAYYERIGRPEDALRLYQSGAQKGLAGPMVKLAQLYAAGKGVPRNDAEALRLYRAGGKGSSAGAFRAVDDFEVPAAPAQ